MYTFNFVLVTLTIFSAMLTTIERRTWCIVNILLQKACDKCTALPKSSFYEHMQNVGIFPEECCHSACLKKKSRAWGTMMTSYNLLCGRDFPHRSLSSTTTFRDAIRTYHVTKLLVSTMSYSNQAISSYLLFVPHSRVSLNGKKLYLTFCSSIHDIMPWL